MGERETIWCLTACLNCTDDDDVHRLLPRWSNDTTNGTSVLSIVHFDASLVSEIEEGRKVAELEVGMNYRDGPTRCTEVAVSSKGLVILW